jgi:hypothetical protein
MAMPPMPIGFSRLCAGPAPKPSRDIAKPLTLSLDMGLRPFKKMRRSGNASLAARHDTAKAELSRRCVSGARTDRP